MEESSRTFQGIQSHHYDKEKEEEDGVWEVTVQILGQDKASEAVIFEHKIKELQKLSAQENKSLGIISFKNQVHAKNLWLMKYQKLNEDTISTWVSWLTSPFASEPMMGQPGTNSDPVFI